MQEPAESSGISWRALFGYLAVVLLVLFFGSVVMRSRNYMSVARLDVTGAAIATGVQTNAPAFPGTNAVMYDPYVIQTEFERMLSDARLTQVIAELRGVPGFLEHTRIGQDTPLSEAIRRLRRLITVRQIRSTSLVEIGAHTRHPEISADLANKIAELYIRGWKTNGVQILMVDRAAPAVRR